jgi:hypothetical protein
LNLGSWEVIDLEKRNEGEEYDNKDGIFMSFLGGPSALCRVLSIAMELLTCHGIEGVIFSMQMGL